MNADFSLIENNDNFLIHPHQIAGETVLLAQPRHIGTEWTPETMIFRSSVWNLQGEPVSLSFKKFFNWGEKPHLTPPPGSLKGAELLEKIDGSTLIFSRYKGVTIIRTRGTVDARKMENGHEIDFLLEKYPDFAKMLEVEDTIPFSYIFEWTSPLNRIVINYGDEPDMVLTAIVRHIDYKYEKQKTLDTFADVMNLRRPKTYSYDSVEEMKQAVDDFKGVEGLCVYFNGGQDILKLKAVEYLAKHRMKSELSSMDKVIDLWFVAGRLSYNDFYEYCVNAFDFEIANDALGFISNICDAWKEVLVIERAMKEKAASLVGMTRKDQAAIVLQAYGQTNRASFVFQLLDGKQWSDDAYKKLLHQCLKK